MDTVLLSLLCTVVASGAAMVATFMNYLQSRHAKKTYQVEIFLKLSEQYAAPLMSSAFATLTKWYFQDTGDFAERFLTGYHAEDVAALKVNEARRTVLRFYLDTVLLYKAEILEREIFRTLTGRYGQRILLHICLPLTHKLTDRLSEMSEMEKILRDLNQEYLNPPQLKNY